MNIHNIIKKKKIKSNYQAIVSINKRKILGYEALSRGISEDNQEISPFLLFEEAKKENKLKELDYLCIEQSLTETPTPKGLGF